MTAQVEQIATMSETLESAGFTQPQATAVIESLALAMETFGVTPEILDDRIDGLREEMNAQFTSQGEDIKDLRKTVNRLERNMLNFQERMIEFQRSTIRYMLAFLVLMLGAVVGMFGTIFSQFLVT